MLGSSAYGPKYYADTVEGSECVVDKKDSGAVYEVYWVKSETVALEYLRHRDVRQLRHYVIIETLGRNIGRDLIMIFDEADGTLIEIPERTPLPDLQPSTTHCARCGYPVLTIVNHPDPPDDPRKIVVFTESPDEVVLKGWGYRCTGCSSAACAACYRATGQNTETTAEGVQWYRCWVCESPVTALIEWAQGA